MLLDIPSTQARATIVEARDRFARRNDAEPVPLDALDAEISSALRSLIRPQSHGVAADSRTDPLDGATRDKPSPDKTSANYLEALEMISSAATLLSAMESHSQKVQAKAYEITQRARLDVLAANERVAVLRQQLSESEARIEDLAGKLAATEEQAQTAQQWLHRFQDTIMHAFPACKAAEFCPTGD